MTLAVRGIFELFKLVKRENELHREILTFSISHDHRTVRLYGYYPIIDGPKTKIYRHPIHTFDITALDGKERWTTFNFTVGVYSYSLTLLKKICSVIDELPPDFNLELSQKFEPQLSESSGLSQLAVGLPEEHQTSEAGVVAQDLFPYNSHYYKEVLLAHAQLYTFAVYHQVKDLQDLSLQRRTQVLTRIDCRQSHAASETAALVQHVYLNTLPAKYSKDAARNLVSQFAAINFDQLIHGEFETLLEQGGDFVLDVSREVSRHLRSFSSLLSLAEDHTRELQNEVQTLKEAAQKREEDFEPPDPWGTFGTATKRKSRK